VDVRRSPLGSGHHRPTDLEDWEQTAQVMETAMAAGITNGGGWRNRSPNEYSMV